MSSSTDEVMVRRRTNLAQSGGILVLVFGGGCSFGVSELFNTLWQPDLFLKDFWKHFICASSTNETVTTFKEASPRDALRLYVAESNWNAMLVLESAAALLALVFAAAVIANQLRRRAPGTPPHFRHAVLVLGILALGLDMYFIWPFHGCSVHVRAALSDALNSLPGSCSAATCNAVFWARLVGEPSGFVVGVAMALTVTFSGVPSERELCASLAQLEKLLYVASVLFVTGNLMSHANFDLILAHWVADEGVTKSLAEVSRAGQVQAGVGYSVLLAVFYIPARLLVSRFVDWSVPIANRYPPAARSTWTSERGLSSSWQKDAQQLFALLAPVLSVPVFSILAK